MLVSHMQSPTSSLLSSQSTTTESASEVDSTADNYSTIIDSVDETTLGTCPLLNIICDFSVCVCVAYMYA